MDTALMGTLRGLATLLAMTGFVAVCVWAWSRRRRAQFDEAARMPLEEDK